MTFRRPGRTLLLLMLCLSALAGCRTWSAREERAAQAYNRGNSLREAGRYEEAAAAYRDALAEAPEFRAASFNLALVLAESGGAGDAGESLQILEDLRSRDPRNLMILNALAWAAWKSGNPELSLEYYDAALEVFPADPAALHGKADVLDGDGRAGEAADVRLIIIELEPDTANRLDLAASYMAAGDAGPALEVYRDVLAEDADNPDALEGAVAASVSMELSRVELEYRRRAISAATGDTAAHRFAVARLLLVDFGDYEEGLASLERALDAGFNDPERTGELLGAAPPTIRPAIRNLLTEYGR